MIDGTAPLDWSGDYCWQAVALPLIGRRIRQVLTSPTPRGAVQQSVGAAVAIVRRGGLLKGHPYWVSVKPPANLDNAITLRFSMGSDTCR